MEIVSTKSISIEHSLWINFGRACKEEGSTKSGKLRILIKNYLNDRCDHVENGKVSHNTNKVY